MSDLTTTALTCNYMHNLVDKTSKKYLTFLFLAHIKSRNSSCNFCVHYSFNVWTHEYNVAIQVCFFFCSYRWSSNRTKVKHPLITFRVGESQLYLKHLCPYFPASFSSDFYIPSVEPVAVRYCWRKSTIKFLFCQPQRGFGSFFHWRTEKNNPQQKLLKMENLMAKCSIKSSLFHVAGSWTVSKL